MSVIDPLGANSPGSLGHDNVSQCVGNLACPRGNRAIIAKDIG